MAKICLCLTGSTMAENLELIGRYRGKIDLAELRGDLLSSSERYFIRRFPELAGLPVILTVRRPADGGRWQDGEGARLVLMAKGLSFADSDPRKNYAYVDLESDLHAPSIEEAARAFRIKIIRSHHDIGGMPQNCEVLLRGLPRHPDEIAKLAVRPQSIRDCLEILRASDNSPRLSRIVIGMGNHGLWTRILADRLGSYLTFVSSKASISAAPGQIDPDELLEYYRFRSISQASRLYADLGLDLPGPALSRELNDSFSLAGEDKAMIPMAADALSDFLNFADITGLAGFCSSQPRLLGLKLFSSALGPIAAQTGIVTALRRCMRGWEGEDLDSPAMRLCLKDALGKRGIIRPSCVILGGGDRARSAIFAARLLGLRPKVTDRRLLGEPGLGLSRARSLVGADGDKLVWAPTGRFFIQASEGQDRAADPLPFYIFSGRDRVLDLGEAEGPSGFCERARGSGCGVVGDANFKRERAERIRLFFQEASR